MLITLEVSSTKFSKRK